MQEKPRSGCGLCARSFGPIVMESDCWKLVVNVNQNLLGKVLSHVESALGIRI